MQAPTAWRAVLWRASLDIVEKAVEIAQNNSTSIKQFAGDLAYVKEDLVQVKEDVVHMDGQWKDGMSQWRNCWSQLKNRRVETIVLLEEMKKTKEFKPPQDSLVVGVSVHLCS